MSFPVIHLSGNVMYPIASHPYFCTPYH